MRLLSVLPIMNLRFVCEFANAKSKALKQDKRKYFTSDSSCGH